MNRCIENLPLACLVSHAPTWLVGGQDIDLYVFMPILVNISERGVAKTRHGIHDKNLVFSAEGPDRWSESSENCIGSLSSDSSTHTLPRGSFGAWTETESDLGGHLQPNN